MMDPLGIAVSLLLGAAVFMIVYSVFRFPVPADPPVHRRIAAAMGIGQRQTVFEQPVIEPLMALGLAIAQRADLPGIKGRIRQDLNASGNPNGYSVDEYLAICIMSGMSLGGAALIMEMLTVSGIAIIFVPVVTGIGSFIPYYLLNESANKRSANIAKKLPYTLDLIALTMASGSTFTEAVETTIRDEPQDDFNQELAIVQAEIGFGTARSQALANLAERIPLETLRSIVGAVNQAESLGTPMSLILKEQATMLRATRAVRAEKLSASASLRILLPSMLILVAVVLVVFGPFIIRYLRGELL